jgi:chitinase
VISAFGETIQPTTQGLDPAKTANDFADFALQLGVDGVDVDYEDLDAMNKKDGSAETWLTTFTNTLRSKLPAGQFELSHAPLGPWFSPVFTSGAYVAVEKNTNGAIDFYNIQFYNQLEDYTTCDGLFNVGPADFPKSAVFEIAAQGIPIEKLVVGKPGTTQDITRGGFIDPATLGGCLADAKAKGFNAVSGVYQYKEAYADDMQGAMAFQFPHADAAWVKAVRGSAFAAGGSTAPAPPAAPASDPTVSSAPSTPTDPAAPNAPAAPSGAGVCTDPAWDPTTQFLQGTKVSFQGHKFTAAFFSQGTQPGTAVACQDGTITCKPWTDEGAC